MLSGFKYLLRIRKVVQKNQHFDNQIKFKHLDLQINLRFPRTQIISSQLNKQHQRKSREQK